MEKANANDNLGATVVRGMDFLESANATGRYVVECRGIDGNIKWIDDIENAVVTEGKNYVLDKAFAGVTYSATWYVGLHSTAAYTPTGSETYAAKGITEFTGYSQAARPTAAWSAASSGSKALSSNATFSVNASGTVYGAILVTGSSTKGDSTASAGVNALWSVGNFTGGSKAVSNGDTLSVSYTTSL